MSSQQTWLTQEAADRLAAELAHLEGEGRKEITAKIEAARAEGDLKENGGYHAARDEQGKMEARIRQLKQMLENAHIGTPPASADGKVGAGMVVTAIIAGDESKFLLGSREIASGDLDVYSEKSPLRLGRPFLTPPPMVVRFRLRSKLQNSSPKFSEIAMSQSHPTFPAYSLADAEQEVSVSLIKYGEDEDQVLEFYGEQNQAKSTLFLIHGGYWRNLFDREHMRPLAVALAKANYYVVLPEFRRISGNPDITLRDLSFAISTLSDLKLTLIGYSSGGHLALLLADKFPAVKKVIGLAPVTDLIASQELELGRGAVFEWLGRNAEERPELDPIRRPPISAETIFIHGEVDERVPLDLTCKYVEKIKREGREIRLEILPETSHFQMMEIPSRTFDALIKAIN
jgi:transcription elongation factor GreA